MRVLEETNQQAAQRSHPGPVVRRLRATTHAERPRVIEGPAPPALSSMRSCRRVDPF